MTGKSLREHQALSGANNARQVLNHEIKEKELQGLVMRAMKDHGWLSYHSWSSIHSEAGFPDILALRDSAMLVIELKREAGKLSPAQQIWLDAFRAVADPAGFEVVDVYVWRPSDWIDGTIDAILAR